MNIILNVIKLFFLSKRVKSLLNFIPAILVVNGKNILIQGSKIYGYLKVDSNVKINECYLSGNVEIGRYTSLNGPNTSLISSGKGKIIVGSFCSIARGVQIQEFNHRFDRVTSYFIGQNVFNKSRESDIISKGDINIEDDVWIGTNCVILSGVKIGRGSIIAAGSVVNKDVEPYSIVGGIPAEKIKLRFDLETINLLNESEWWTWSVEKIRDNEAFFLSQRC